MKVYINIISSVLLIVVLSAGIAVGIASYIHKSILLKDLPKIVTEIAEVAYFSGQQDALKGDICIAQDSCGTWYWTKSPWDSGKEPTFNPKMIQDGKN